MICAHCKAQIEDGSLYCNRCGRAVQIVPDYNVLEDDELFAMIQNGEKRIPISNDTQDVTVSHEEKRGLFATRSARRVALLFMGMFAILIVGFVSIYYYTHTYGFLINQGKAAADAENYDSAIGYYREALAETTDPGESLILIAQAQVGAGYTDEAEKTLFELLDLDENNLIAFSILAEMYNENDDLDGLESLVPLAVSEEQKKLIDDMVIPTPEFSIPGGEFKDDIELTISAEAGFDIYYTMDGSTPSAQNGKKYDGEPIMLSVGSTQISAVCIRGDKKAGRPASETYTIIYEAPSLPVVSPSGGRLTRQTSVTITTDSLYADLYYTWDGTIPTSASRHYEGPIEVPEGNSILSVIAIDKHGLISPVLQVNYIYLP
ncbi:MAG: chitobiase/beta-hexosaminidase C-terminal domain-containing protein [Lachnospiraceae bacterium]|nr:chitobiase/beta-hexosaminidase C-terminal domain-containing protein [Lachnospiraceae bacterium]